MPEYNVRKNKTTQTNKKTCNNKNRYSFLSQWLLTNLCWKTWIISTFLFPSSFYANPEVLANFNQLTVDFCVYAYTYIYLLLSNYYYYSGFLFFSLLSRILFSQLPWDDAHFFRGCTWGEILSISHLNIPV